MCSRTLDEQITEVDGGFMEGGGQTLRIALALSIIQKVAVRIHNIRAGRDKPGLRPQHLKGVEIGQQICAGKLLGAQIGSTDISLYPGNIRCGNYCADTKTAGSTGLLIQVALPCALFSNGPTRLNLRGGTNADMAPQIDYTIEVFKPILEKFGGTFEALIEKRGYFPRGQGIVNVIVQPVAQLNSVEMVEQGSIDEIWGRAFVAGNLPLSKAEEMASAASKVLRASLKKTSVKIIAYKETPQAAFGSQAGINIFARSSTGCIYGSSGLSSRGTSDAEVGAEAARQLAEDLKSGACVDQYAQDQVIILMALAHGKSRIKCGPISLHTKTAIATTELLTKAKFTITEVGLGSNIIECLGTGFINENLN